MNQTVFPLGFNARLFPNHWRPAVEEIAFAQRQGFDAVQFPGEEQGLRTERLGGAAADIGQAAREAGILAVMEINFRVDARGLAAQGGTPFDVLQANVPAIIALGCSLVHLHLVPANEMSSAELRTLEALVTPHFEAGVALAKQHGFRLSVEHNEPRIDLFATPQRCQALLEAVPGLGFVWDLNHVTPDQFSAYLDLTPHMTMLHVSDTPLPTVNWHLPLGMGNIDLGRYLGALRQRGFQGPAILEIGGLPASGGYGRDTDDALLDSRDRWVAAVAALQP